MRPFTLLVAGDDGAGSVIGVLVLIAVSVIAAIFQKASQKTEQKRAEQDYQRRRQEREAGARKKGATPYQHPPTAGRPAAAPPRPTYTTQPQYRPTPPPAPPTGQAVDMVALQGQRQRERELHLEQQRMAEQVAIQEAAKAAPEPLAVTPALAHPTPPPTGQAHPLFQVPSDLRRAIVLHEIFSSPKALRRAPEPWEL